MANEFGANLNVTTDQWAAIWQWMRRMQKAGYWLRASSNGTTKVVSDDPTAHAVLLPSNTANVGAAASITAVEVHPYGYLMTLMGLTGLVAPTVTGGNSEGCFLTISGAATGANNGTFQTYEIVSATSAKVLVRSGTPVAGDANNGAISWQEKDPVGSQTYTFGGAMWWVCFEGMETYQICFSSEPAGTFVSGEILTQATSGATGEFLGRVWDPLTSKGWMIVMPRMGAWNATNVITGGTSGATATPTAVHKFRRQFVYTKGSASNNWLGSGWYGIYRDSSANQLAELWSTKAAHAACTATVAPGASTTAGNRFRNSTATWGCYVTRCRNNLTENGVTALVHANGIICDTLGGASSSNGRAQVSVANIMPGATRSADGTAWVIHGYTLAAFGGALAMHGWFRIDGGEEGEPEVLVNFAHAIPASNWASRYENENGNISATYAISYDTFRNSISLQCWYKAYACAEGVGGQVDNIPLVSASYGALTGNQIFNDVRGMWCSRNWGSTFRSYSHPAATAPAYKEPYGIHRGFWGRLRWMYAIQQGVSYQTFESRKYICVYPYSAINNYFGMMIGPWDQSSDPLQS